MKKLGLTGNIASGKSQVEKILKNKGFKVVDLDEISHKILENSFEIKEHFKTTDRKIIGKIVFSNPDEKKFLESVIHPLLYNYILDEFKKDYDKIVISGALLYEAGFDKLFDKIIFVDAPYNLRLERLMKRNNLDIESAKIRINAQNDDNKIKADYIINNSKTLEDLEFEVVSVINSIL